MFGCATNSNSTIATGQNSINSTITNPSGDSNESTTSTNGTITTMPNDESSADNTSPDDIVSDSNVGNSNANDAVCGHTNTKVVDNYNATCIKNGYTGDIICTDCDVIISYGQPIDATGHGNTTIKNQKDATCATAGYTGDSVCVKCNDVVSSGTSIPATGHGKTILKNQKIATCTTVGYTGDDVCTVCNKVVRSGSTIAKLPHDEVVVGYIEPTSNSEGYTGNTICSVCNVVITYGQTIAKLESQDKYIIINHNGYEYVVTFPYGVNPWDYTSKRANKSDTHSNVELEKKIFNLLNDERINAGLAPLEWDESGYYFTKLRSEESVEFFSHTRPNGEYCFSVYYEENVYAEHFGENLYRGINVPEEFDWAQMAVDGWMNSPGHRANILDADFTKCAIAFVQVGDTFIITHHFYG